ncbi:hypothetical protein D9758_009176 [Tetrapyrgos nigripes]|uniref:Uncharacterized protein n=1 Tax=Tetrapyrgos nigripes TaxID=182062 RepID=A0A8H5G8L8_9AGAR|nr:hypothetical protein D9758_009176 [Tetrapyrgos nigripes]
MLHKEKAGKTVMSYEPNDTLQPLSYPAPSTDINLPTYTGASSVTRFACLSMHGADRIHFLRLNASEVEAMRKILNMTWSRGIQEERDKHGAVEFKLKGLPWGGAEGKQTVQARQMLCGILEALYNLGWVIVSSTDVSKNSYEQDTIFLRYQYPAPPRCSWMSISFHKGDRLRLINAPEGVTQSIRHSFASMIQKDEWKDLEKDYRSYELKFQGYPWHYSNRESSISARVLLLQLLEVLEQNGFTLYVSVDQNRSWSDASRDIDT